MWLYLTLGLIALVIYYLTSCKPDYWERNGVPTASGCEWFFGHFRPVLSVKKHINDFYSAMYKEFPNAPLVGYYMMNVPGLLIRDLELIKFIMVSEFSSFNANGLSVDKNVDILAGANRFFLVGEEWKIARNRLTPALTLSKLKGYLPTMLNVADEMVKYIKNVARPTAELETRELAKKYTTDVIANAIFGIKNNTFENKDSFFTRITNELVFDQSVTGNLINFIQQLPIVRTFYPARFMPQKLQDLLVTLVSNIIAEKSTMVEKGNDAIQILLALKENEKGSLTIENITGQMSTIMTDLYYTSSSMTSLFLYRLSRHPDIQEKLRAEFKDIKSRTNGEITIEDIENAKYLEMVFSECFRMYCFTSYRACTQDCYLPVPNSKPLKITKGTTINIPAICIHMDAKYYPDPETFNPERFTEEEIAKRPKFTYLPWGEGPKKCPGIRIATLEIKIALMKIIENFTLTVSPKTEFPLKFDPTAPFTIRPKEGAWVIFKEI